jgi:hypothetical protein
MVENLEIIKLIMANPNQAHPPVDEMDWIMNSVSYIIYLTRHSGKVPLG